MRIIVLFIFVLFCLCVGANGQEEGVAPLKLIIKVNKRNICFGKPVDFTATLTNISSNPVVIDTKQIGYKTNFSWFVNKSQGIEAESSTTIGHFGRNYEPNLVILQPNESYTENEPFVFDDEVLNKSRNYKMQITYGQFLKNEFNNIDVWNGTVNSNEIDIFIKRCEIK